MGSTNHKLLYSLYGKLLNTLPQRSAILIEYKRMLGYFPNLDNPKTLNEKIQWLKLHGDINLMGRLSDKLNMKEHVSKILGPEFILPANWVGKSLPETMPNTHYWQTPYVLKATHGCMMNYFSKENKKWNQVRDITQAWMNSNFRPHLKEPQYKTINKMLFIEEELPDPTDYKFYCIHGKVELIVIVKDRAHIKKEFILDPYWNTIVANKYNTKKPTISSELTYIAEKLSKDINFVRIDMYIKDNKPIVGEFSFTPAAGYDRDLQDLDLKLGKKLNLF